MPKDLTLRGLARLLEENERFVLTTHSSPDADGVGSELALQRFLLRRGKKCRTVNVSATPRNLLFLCSDHDIERYDPKVHRKALAEADVIIAVDLGSVEKVDAMKNPILASRAQKVLIDHHVKRDKAFDLHWVREGASSSGEMIYDLLTAFRGCALTPDIAQPLLAAIVHDTGNFSYDRTTEKTFRVAADLVAHGASPYEIFKHKQCSRDLSQIRLIGEALRTTKVSRSGLTACCAISRRSMRRYGVDVVNMPSVIDHILTLASIEVAIVLVEAERGNLKVSLRSKSDVDVSALAHEFGGGGHRRSAGLTMSGPLSLAAKALAAKAERVAKAAVSPHKTL